MKILVAIIFVFLIGGDLIAQNKADTAFSLTLQMPEFLKQGEHTNLKAIVKNRSGIEFSGRAVLEIINTETGKPIDGWFQNIFPQQYFTIEAGQSATVNFDIHVPYNVSKPVKCKVMAHVGKKSSIKETTITILK